VAYVFDLKGHLSSCWELSLPESVERLSSPLDILMAKRKELVNETVFWGGFRGRHLG